MIIDMLPEGYIKRMRTQLAGEACAFFDALEKPPVRGLRMRRGALPEGAGPRIPWASNGFYLTQESRAGASAVHEAGAFYLQEPSAMIPAAVLDPQPGERILDLCAAPGGKSTQIGALMRGRGLLVSNEPVYSRAKVLSMNIERMGIANAVVTSAMPQDLEDCWKGTYDRVLVDAPCSGEGMFRRHPEAAEQWYEGINEACAQRQALILSSAARMLRDGGTLVYSTCTFSPDENERVIEDFLLSHKEFTLEPFAIDGLPPNDGMMTFYPHHIQGEGHFAAKLRKNGDASRDASFHMPYQKKSPAAEWLRQIGFDLNDDLICPFAGRSVLLPEKMVPLKGIKVLRMGLDLCEERGGRFVPLHALALWQERVDIDLDQDEAVRFIHGEAIQKNTPLKGYVIAGYEGCPLGWGKASDGIVKNHYPKGLRKQLQVL